MTFIVNIETKAEHFDEAKQLFAEREETVTLIQTTGNCHLVAVCVSESVKTMRDFVNMVNRKIEGITYISAHSVLDVVKGSIIPE